MILEVQRARPRRFFHFAWSVFFKLLRVVNQHTVVPDTYLGILRFVATRIKLRLNKVDVVRLPTPRWITHVDLRFCKLINGTTFIGGTWQAERIQNLYFVPTLDVSTAIAT